MAVIRWGNETQITNISWLWKPLIPYGKVTLIEGDGGDGKTTLILTVAAMLSRGDPPPTLQGGRLLPAQPVPPVTTFYLTNEDEIADSSLKRFLRAGGIFQGIVGGVKFHPVGTACGGSQGHFRLRVDEDGGPDAGLMETGADCRQEVLVPEGVPSRVGGDGVRGVRHEGDLVRPHFEDEIDEGGNRISFDVEFRMEQRADFPYVGVADVPLVRSGMNRNAFCTETFDVEGRFRNIRQIPAAGIADGGYFIDINA